MRYRRWLEFCLVKWYSDCFHFVLGVMDALGCVYMCKGVCVCVYSIFSVLCSVIREWCSMWYVYGIDFPL